MKKLLLVSVVGLILSLLALVVTAVPAQFPDNIYLKSRPTMLTLSIIQQNHMLVQFDHVLTDEEKAELSASGINLLNYIPDRAWFIAGKVDKLGKRPDVTYIGAISSESKISPSLSKTWTGNVNILFFSDVPTDVARNILSKYTRTINGPQPGNVWTITATPDAITRLALEDNVMWIEPFPEYQILNDGSRAAIFVNTVQTSPYNLNGTGVSVAEWDAGHAELTHDDFTGHIIAGDSSSTHSHATHVAGTMAGNGNRSAGTLRGMAPNATIITYEWPYDLEELYNETNDSIITYNAILSQNSWGYNVHNNCNEMGDYDIWSAAYDNLTRGNGITRSMLFVFSAGNERATNPPYCGQYGYSWNTTLGPGGTAKNSLTVGALNSNDNSMTSFSSWGPTDDGRIKPDVVAPGCQVGGDGGINSTYPTNTYSVMCGTSMASPAVSGVVALMHQAYRVNHSGADPKPATDKAILIH
ncbi:MAG: S8 family serine peptidase, partial [Candidatus Aenigmatarchaeota archaeon]